MFAAIAYIDVRDDDGLVPGYEFTGVCVQKSKGQSS